MPHPIRAREERAPTVTSRIVVPDNRGTKIVRAVTIRRPAEELFAFCREISNLSRIIKRPVEITLSSREESHWSLACDDDKRVAWDIVIINETPNELIAWRTREGSDVAHAGSVRFERAPADEGTEVTVALEYDSAGGATGSIISKLSDDTPVAQVADALRRFKALMEAGEIPTTGGQPTGRGRKGSRERKPS